jgi:hypothetical protein
MDRFIHRENLKHYREMLNRATDETQRQTLLRLIAEEEARTELDDPPKKD